MSNNLKSLMSEPVDFKREFIAGLTTFLTMSYIVVVNPAILSAQVNGVSVGLSFQSVMTATVMLTVAMTFLMGFYAKLPFAVAPGMGINAFFAYTLVLGRGVPVERALGMVFWAGVLFLVISLTPLRMRIAQAIPAHLRVASAGGIGVFLAFIGFRNANWIVADPVTFVKMGEFNQSFWICGAGLALLIFLLMKKSRFAFLGGIAASCVMAVIIALSSGKLGPDLIQTSKWVSWPDFSAIGKLDLVGALLPATWSAIVSILFTDLFDSISTFVGVSEATGLKAPDGQPKNLREGLIVDAWATLTAGILGTSSGTAYIESAAGIEAGGRTGWTAIFAALFFIPCIFFGPLVAMVPAAATAPVLIVVGVLMFRSVLSLGVKSKPLEDLIPTVLTVVLIPLSFSITQGMLWGFLLHAPLYFLAGRKKELSPWMTGISVLSGALLLFEHLN